jgi:hypothetical protein
MASSYDNDLRLEEMGTGEQIGSWGTTTNTNLSLIAEAFSYQTEATFSSDADVTATIADGASDKVRAFYLKVTSSATLSATRTLTIAPNTLSKVIFIENATSGAQSINISQGSGANVTVGNGLTKACILDGGGSGAVVHDMFDKIDLGANAKLNGGDFGVTASSTTTFTNKTFDANGTNNSITNLEVADFATGVLDTDLNTVATGDTTLASAKAIKTYVDAQVATVPTGDITAVVAGTGLSGGATSGSATLNIDTATTVDISTSQALSNKTLTSPVINTGVSGSAILDEDNFASDSDTKLATQQSIKAYVASQVATANELSELTDVNITSAADGALLFYDTATSKWIDNVVSGDITIADTGVATIAAGAVDNAMLSGNIANSKLVNDSVSFGGVSLDLGQSDATPAFDLSDATNYPTSSLTGTITNAQLAGSIADSKLNTITTADKVSAAAVQVDGATDGTGITLATTDKLIVDDAGTTKYINASQLNTYLSGQGFTTDDPTALAIALG